MTSTTVEFDVSGSGAVARGTTRELAPLMRDNRWRWSRTLGAWYLPRTWRHETVDRWVARTVEALATAAVASEIVGGDDRNTEAQRAQRRLERTTELIDVHEARARDAEERSRALGDRAGEISDRIPMGQPVLAGHHSERRHRRDLERIRNYSSAAAEAAKDAEGSRRKARAARARVAEARSELPRFGPDDVRAGDLVQHRSGSWHKVLRVNAKSVTIPALVGGESVSWTDRLSWDKIRDVRRPEQALDRLKEASGGQVTLPALEQ